MAGRAKGVVVPITATDNTARAFDSVNVQVERLRAQIASLRSNAGGPGEALAQGFGHAVPQMAAASAAIRTFEGALPLRALERLTTLVPGLGQFLQKAFIPLAIFDAARAVGEVISKISDMRKEAAGAGDALKKGFGDINNELKTTNAELTVSNDKLADEIAKLEGRPGDGLRTGLDEASLAAQRLGQNLDKDLDKVKELFEKNKVGFFGGLLSGSGETKDSSNLVLYEKQQIDKVRKEYDDLVATARSGGDKGNIEQAEQQRLGALQNAYTLADQALGNAQAAAQKAQDFRNSTASAFGSKVDTSGSGVNFSSAKDNSANVNILGGGRELFNQEQQEIGGSYLQGQQESSKSLLEANKARTDAGNKAEELRRKQADADEKFAAATRTLADSQAKSLAATEKAAVEAKLDALESSHRALLVSDEQYYSQREALQNQAVAAQRAAVQAQRTDLQTQVTGAEASGRGLTGVDAENNQSKIIELKAKINDLDRQDATLTGEIAKNIRTQADAITDLTNRRIVDADRLAAQLETERGGSTAARSKQSKDEYDRRRLQLIGEYGSENAPAVQSLDSQQKIDQADITAKGADQDLSRGDAGRGVARKGIDDELKRGQISQQEAQRERIALDREEADALGPVLAAYKALAATGDANAAGKVAELQQRILELKTPVNEVAAEIRDQIGSALERLVEGMDKPKKAFQDLLKAIQTDVTKDVYKNFIAPGIQSGLGQLIPNQKGQNLPSSPTAAAAGGLLTGVLGKVPGLGGVFGGGKGSGTGAGTLKVEIVNQGGQSMQVDSATGNLDAELEDKVVSIVLKNMDSGGSLRGLFGG